VYLKESHGNSEYDAEVADMELYTLTA